MFKSLRLIEAHSSTVLNIWCHQASRTTRCHEAYSLWMFPRKRTHQEKCASRIPFRFTWKSPWIFLRFCVWLALPHRKGLLLIRLNKWTPNPRLSLCPHICRWQRNLCTFFFCFWTLPIRFRSSGLFSIRLSMFYRSLRNSLFRGLSRPLCPLHSKSWAWWVFHSPTYCHSTSFPHSMNHH